MLMVVLGVVLGYDAWRGPTPTRLAGVALVGAGLLYTQYWSLFLVGVVGLGLLAVAVRGDAAARRPSRRLLAALGGSVVIFLPWVPTLRDQLAHTGTPWDAPASLVPSTARTVFAFGGGMVAEGWILAPVLLGLGVLAVLARPVDRRRIELDLRTVPGVRVLAITTAAVVLAGIGLSQIMGTGMQDRYAAVVFPLAALVAAYGLLAFGDPRHPGRRAGGGRARWDWPGACARCGRRAPRPVRSRPRWDPSSRPVTSSCTARTSSVRPPHDCSRRRPARSCSRTSPGRGSSTGGTTRIATPPRRRPSSPGHVVARAGAGRIWLVWSPGFRTLDAKCEAVVDALGTARPATVDVRAAAGPNGERVDLRRFDP